MADESGSEPIDRDDCQGYGALPSAVIVLMGVSGAGKTTVGKELAVALGCQFHDGDDFHPQKNVEKMSHGMPLTDEDRKPWLATLQQLINGRLSQGEAAVITCSALKKSYRQQLLSGNHGARLIYLKGSFELIEQRLLARTNHYMKADLLASQFRDLEEPTCALVLDASLRPARLVKLVMQHLPSGELSDQPCR